MYVALHWQSLHLYQLSLTLRLLSDNDLVSWGKGQYFGASDVASGYPDNR